MSTEETLFSEDGVTVTSARFVLSGRYATFGAGGPAATYAMSGVTSVALVVTNPEKERAIHHIKAGLWLSIFLLPLLLTAWGIFELFMAKPFYNVQLESAAGRDLVFWANDEALVRRVVDSITDAIVARA